MDKQEPVAWLYEREDGSRDLVLDCNGEYARRLLELGATETPLYTRANRPADDGLVDELVVAISDLAVMELDADDDDPRLGYFGDKVRNLVEQAPLVTTLRAQSDAEVERDRLRETLIEARDQLWLMAKDPEDNYLIKQCNAALGEHRKDRAMTAAITDADRPTSPASYRRTAHTTRPLQPCPRQPDHKAGSGAR